MTVGKSATDAKPTARDSLRYGPDGARYLKKSEWAVKSGNTTTVKTSRKYYAGAYEKTVTVGGDTVERIRVSDSVVHVRTTPASGTATAAFEYAHRDHLGSLEAVTNASGKTLTVLGHDPYGERRNDWSSQLTPAQIGTLLDGHGERVSRGFTGHEHLDRTGLIHMNGRIYDPRLGRFLSPDPVVGDPDLQPVLEPLQLRRQQPPEPCRSDRGVGGACRHGVPMRLAVRGGRQLLDGLVVCVECVARQLGGCQPMGLQHQLRPCRKPARRRGTDAQGTGCERGGPADGRQLDPR